MTHREEFDALVSRAASSFRTRINKATIDEWWEHFQSLPFYETSEALTRLQKTHDRMPSLREWLAATEAIMVEHGFGAPADATMPGPEGTADPRRPYTKAWHHLTTTWQTLRAHKMTGWEGMEPEQKALAERKYQLLVKEIADLTTERLQPKPTMENPDPPAPPQLVALAVAAEERVRQELFGDAVPA